jgi:hypothetical protein
MNIICVTNCHGKHKALTLLTKLSGPNAELQNRTPTAQGQMNDKLQTNNYLHDTRYHIICIHNKLITQCTVVLHVKGRLLVSKKKGVNSDQL